MWSPSRSPEIWNVPGMFQAATELQRVDSRAVGGPRPGGNPHLGCEVPYRPREGPPGTTARLGSDAEEAGSRLGTASCPHRNQQPDTWRAPQRRPLGHRPSAPQPLKFVFTPPRQAHGVAQSGRSGIAYGHSPLPGPMSLWIFHCERPTAHKRLFLKSRFAP